MPIAEDVRYPHGTQAMLHCPPDHYLEVKGNYWKMCVNGVWNGSLGECKPLA
ncbi:unnamed protein product [Gongylonema pulchrum]|uniref:Sushi domain-containing protein n=1 Tax=Gongylonema pulchrum TaxID=637853 RepID=A0A3P6RYP2_9BILA|nr:unnamed protein product [Gongylonema pulchrum]